MEIIIYCKYLYEALFKLLFPNIWATQIENSILSDNYFIKIFIQQLCSISEIEEKKHGFIGPVTELKNKAMNNKKILHKISEHFNFIIAVNITILDKVNDTTFLDQVKKVGVNGEMSDVNEVWKNPEGLLKWFEIGFNIISRLVPPSQGERTMIPG